ncbi:MAG TPA: hypothetical protein VMH85_06080 [Terriglobales bacterium]|nr:hypothetical protein [Terriglobales bacterium]
MRKVAKVGVLSLSVLVVTVILFLGYYEWHEFRPYLPRINAVYDRMNAEDREPPPAVQDFISKVEGRKGDDFAASSLLWEIRGYPQAMSSRPMRMSEWHYHSFMWHVFLSVHFGKAKRLSFYCHYLPYENGTGFSESSESYFGRHPDALRLDEIAEIIAIGISPRGNSPTLHPEHLRATKERLLHAYAAAR